MLLCSFLVLTAFAGPDRIESKILDLGLTHKVYLKPGLVSVVEFPKPIVEVRVGNPKSLKAIISQVSPKELTMYFSSSSEVPSNIIVRSDKRVYVLDVIPSQSSHQDFVKVTGFGGPTLTANADKIESVQLKPLTKHQSEVPRVLIVKESM